MNSSGMIFVVGGGVKLCSPVGCAEKSAVPEFGGSDLMRPLAGRTTRIWRSSCGYPAIFNLHA